LNVVLPNDDFVIEGCTRSDQRYRLACLCTKDPDGRIIAAADRDLDAGRSVRLRDTRRELVRVAASPMLPCLYEIAAFLAVF